MKCFSFTRQVRQRWMVIVTVAVAALAGFAVDRLHGAFNADADTARHGGAGNEIVSFNPKHVVYEVSGAPGSTATINYQDIHASLQRIDNAPLPWSYTITTTDPAVIANVIAQGSGNTLGCRITVNGVVKAERTVNEVSAYTFCLDKSG